MNDLDALDLVLSRAREGLSPSDAQVERVWAGIPVTEAGSMAALPRVAGTARPNALGAKPNGRWASFKATGGTGLAAAALLVGSGFAAGYWARTVVSNDAQKAASTNALTGSGERAAPTWAQNDDAESPATAPREPLPVGAPASIEAPAATEETPSRPPAVAHAASSTGTRQTAAYPSEPAARAAGELLLLERIERALRSADAPLALALLAELEKNHPKTRLVEERRAARLMANCVARSEGAPAAAQAFIAAQPASVYASRLRALCNVE